MGTSLSPLARRPHIGMSAHCQRHERTFTVTLGQTGIMAGAFRMRTTMRRHSPFWLLRLGWMNKPDRDCGEHEFYNEDDVIDRPLAQEVARGEARVPRADDDRGAVLDASAP